jgi:tRNA A58 N-methylase Trm61
MTTYAIRGGEEGTRRLDLLSRVVDPTTESFLDAGGIAPGMTCLDAGSGAGHVSRSLARRVGLAGKVVGLERDPVKLAAARADTEREGLRNVE